MNNINQKFHLRVVSSNKDENAKASRDSLPQNPEQLLLNFFDNKKNIFPFIFDSFSSEHFSNILNERKLGYILDLRICPRFDLYGYSRQKAFSEFNANNIKYISLMMDEHTDNLIVNLNNLIKKINLNWSEIDDSIALLIDEDTNELEMIPQKISEFKSWNLVKKNKTVKLKVVK